MSGHDLIFCESAANNMIDDIEHEASKMRDGNTDMSDLVDADLLNGRKVLRLGRHKRSVRSALTIVRRNWPLP